MQMGCSTLFRLFHFLGVFDRHNSQRLLGNVKRLNMGSKRVEQEEQKEQLSACFI